MRFVVRQQPKRPVDLSLVLLDWSCRESFHLLDYLAEQTVQRSRYEIIWIEYYRHPSPPLCQRIEAARAAGAAPPVDTYAVLGMDRSLCYHKHLMLNAGIVLAGAPVVCFCDSDAMVRPTFVQSILDAFASAGDIALHLDEVRNIRTAFYPFAYPDFDDASGFGCINWIDGRPAGLLDKSDPLHTRNYGCCMAGRRRDLIAIGGADMHVDYLGHVCGMYEMTFRLVNAGKREVWHAGEWLYHVWHPGQAGDGNLAGPHDGMQVSTRALEARKTGRVQPFVEDPAIALLRTEQAQPGEEKLLESLIDPQWLRQWEYSNLQTVRRGYRLGRRSIWLNERQGTPAGAAEGAGVVGAGRGRRSPVLFGRRPGRLVRLRLAPMLLGMIWRQLKVKRRASVWSRPRQNGSLGAEWLRKLLALRGFLRRICEFDKHWLRQCWLALAYAAQEKRRDLVLFGEGDAVRALCVLSGFLPVRVRAICPLRHDRRRRLFGRATLVKEQLPAAQATIIVASFVNTDALLEQLLRLGIDRGRIITLQ